MKRKVYGLLVGIVLSFGAIVGINSKDFTPTEAESAHYNLITSISDGDQVAFGESSLGKVAGEHHSNGYFISKDATFVGNEFDGEPQLFTVVKVNNRVYEFKYEDNFIAVNSDSSAISLTTTSSDNTKWYVSFKENNAIIQNVGIQNRYIRYNENSPRFAAYKPNSDNMLYPQLYKVGAPKVLDSISVSGDYKTTYYEGDKFEVDKLTVTAHYTDGTSAKVTNFTIDPADLLETTDTKIVVSYTLGEITKTADINVIVNPNPVTNLIIEGYTTEYYLGDECVFDGVCTATFESGKTAIIDNPDVDTTDVDINTPGTYEVIVSYKEGEASYNVTYSYNTKEKYTLITSTDELEDDMQFLFGVPASNISSGAFSNDNISQTSAEFLDGDLFIQESTPMTLKANEDAWNIYFGDKKLGCVKAKELLLNGKSANNDWNISFDAEGNVIVESSNTNFGRLYYNSSSRYFKNYTSSTLTKIKMYKFEDSSIDAKLDVESFEGNVNETQTVNVICRGFEPDSFAWSTQDEGIATINESDTSTNVVTIVGEGETTVTVEITFEGVVVFTLELPVIGHNYSHDVIEDGSSLVVTYGNTNDAMNPADTSNISNCEYLEENAWTFEAVGKGDNVYALKANNKYLSSKSSDAKGILTDTMQDWFKIEVNDSKFTIKSLVNNKFLVHYTNAQSKVFWYFFDSNYSNINQLSLIAPRVFENLEVVGTPDKLIYNVGESFEINPAKVYALYSNGEEVKVDVTSQLVWDEITLESEYAIGRITLSGLERTVSFEIIVTSYVVDSISVTAYKTEYFVGESVTESDLTVTATLVDQAGGQASKVVDVEFDDLTINPAKFTSTSQNRVEVTYMEKSDSFAVTITEAQYQLAESVTNGDHVVFVCPDYGVEMDMELGSYEYDFAPVGRTVFEVEKGTEDGSKSLREITSNKYLSLDNSKLVLSDTKDSKASWTVTISNEEAFVFSVYSSEKYIKFNPDSCKFSTSSNFNGPIQLFKDITINIPESISVEHSANKTEFEIGEQFNCDGLTIKVNYGGGAFKVIDSGFQVTAPDMTTSGIKTVMVTYHGVSTSYQITVKKAVGPVTPVGLEVSDTKTLFNVGDKFVFNGTVKLKMSDESTQTLKASQYTVYGLDDNAMKIPGKKSVKVEYNDDKSIFTTYEIIVANITLESITLSNIKTQYIVGDSFVKPTVTAHYSDGSTQDITSSATFTGYDMSKAGTQTVKVTYVEDGETFIQSFSITISEQPQPVPPTPAKTGCGGSILATSVILSTLSLAGVAIVLNKKRKEK